MKKPCSRWGDGEDVWERRFLFMISTWREPTKRIRSAGIIKCSHISYQFVFYGHFPYVRPHRAPRDGVVFPTFLKRVMNLEGKLPIGTDFGTEVADHGQRSLSVRHIDQHRMKQKITSINLKKKNFSRDANVYIRPFVRSSDKKRVASISRPCCTLARVRTLTDDA